MKGIAESRPIRRANGQVVVPTRDRIEDLDEVRAFIDGWNLNGPRWSLTSNSMPWDHRWSAEHVEFAEQMYRRWMFLVRKHETERVPPFTYDIDGFWHAHILSTADYAEFTSKVLGYFLHHNGGFGAKDEAEYAELQQIGAQMLEYYHDEYGEPLWEFELG